MVQVEISEGLLEGEIVDNEYGGQFYSFKGIPYAEPPVGDLRFKAPQPIKSWTGIRDAKEHGPVSCQINLKNPTIMEGSEDCLYLNVYSPDIKPKSPLPVMVFIHGGAFKSGSGNDTLYGPEFIVRNGVILVTINYRLGLLGFLCLDTEDIPGNAAMKDQVLALKWVKKNIASFGGDVDNITIFGESAGGCSVGFHLISPMTKGLFKRAIAQSASVTNHWSIAFEPREKALKLAKQLGLYSEDDKELCELFKEVPVEKLLNFKLPAHLAKKDYELDIGIVDEKEFGDNERYYYGEVFDVLRQGIHEGLDVITGYTEDEGLLAFSMMTPDDIYKMSNFYNEFFVPRNLAYALPIKEQLEVGRKVKKYYIPTNLKTEESLDSFLRYLNMEMFVHGIITAAKFYARTEKNKVYFYKFTCKTERNITAHIFRAGGIIKDRITVCHADDLMYLFPVKSIVPNKVDENSNTFKLIENITKMWTNFAKYGNPTPESDSGVEWPQFDIEKQNYLEIGNEFVVRTCPDKEDIEFWESIFKEYLPQHTV